MQKNIDALIVGAGPTGLFLAAELTRYGLCCRIIDKSPQPSDKSKAIAIQPRTLEIFDHVGIASIFIEQGIKIEAANPMSRGKRLAHVSFSSLDSPYPFILSLEQMKTEHILAEHLKAHGIKIERSMEWMSLRKEGESHISILRELRSGDEEHVRSKWVLGCDGAHSTVRKEIGEAFQGKLFADVFSLADIHMDWSYSRHEVFAFLGEEGIIAILPLPEEKRYRLIFQLKRCRNLLKEQIAVDKDLTHVNVPSPTLEETQDLLKRNLGSYVTLKDPVWLTNFHINSRMVNHYRHGSIFLLGDAAHIHSPVGGQGMNTGFQDAFNLAWKLAFVHSGKVREELLDSYHHERHAVGKNLLRGTEWASHIATVHSSLGIRLRNLFMSLFLNNLMVQKRIVRILSQVAIRYPKSSIVCEAGSFHGGPKAGTRAPNGSLCLGEQKIDLYSLWRRPTCYYLLLFNGNQPMQNILAVAQDIKAHYSSIVLPVCIYRGSETFENSEWPIYKDSTGEVHRLYGARKACSYIIRPDIYVGQRHMPLSESALHNYFNQILA